VERSNVILNKKQGDKYNMGNKKDKDTYQMSDEVKAAIQKKIDAENAYNNHGDYVMSDNVTSLGNKKNELQNTVDNWKDFQFTNADWMQNVYDQIQNRKPFSYDLNGDALYQQYKDKYIQQGKMAMQDAIGQASAMTGGYGNSYAATVGNQAYQSHLNNLNDVIPELYQLAYDKYNQKGQDLYNQYSMLSDDYNREYSMHNDEYNKTLGMLDYYTNEEANAFAREYGQWADKKNTLADERTYYANQADNAVNTEYNKFWADKNFQYQQERDKISDQQWATELAERKRQFNVSNYIDNGSETENTINFINNIPSKEDYIKSGYSEDQWKNLVISKLNEADLTDAEFAYLEEYFGLS
jgi:hypothetical protein